MTFAMLALIASWIGTTLPSSDSPTRWRSGLLGNGMTGTTPSGLGSGHGSPGTIRRSQAVPPRVASSAPAVFAAAGVRYL